MTLRSVDLAPWCSARLFRVEVDGALDAGKPNVVIARVRLLEPDDSWPQIQNELGELALARAHALAPSHAPLAEYTGDVAACVQHGMIKGALFVTAMAHATAADLDAADAEARRLAFLRERALQPRFIAERLHA